MRLLQFIHFASPPSDISCLLYSKTQFAYGALRAVNEACMFTAKIVLIVDFTAQLCTFVFFMAYQHVLYDLLLKLM